MVRVFVCLALVICVSCKEDEGPRGYMRALYNGGEWKAETRATTNLEIPGNEISITGTVYSSMRFRRESLTFRPYPRAVGVYDVFYRDFINSGPEEWNQTGWYVTISDDGDVLEDLFNVFEQEDNFLEITAVDGSEVKGNFQVTFVRDTTDKIDNPTLPDTIRFTEGEFVAYVEELN